MTKSGYVAIVGRTNVGKSTLLNKILGTKVSIISDKPQTTRHRILGVHTDKRGQAIFFDTPGVHKPGHELNRQMVHSIYDALHEADVLLHIVDITQKFGHGEEFVLDMVKANKAPAILVINKIDLVKKSKVLEVIDFYRQRHDYAAFIPVSALTGDGVQVVVDELFRLLPEGPFFYDEDYITDCPERFLSAELIREQVLVNTREELPFTTAVFIEQFDESERGEEEGKGLVRIEASIIVEKDTQKAIIIGRQGSMIKQIGSAARKEIEEMLGCHVYLGLFVKVEPDWRNNAQLLKDLGMNS